MNLKETTSLLAMIAAYDNRDWDQGTVAAWGMALEDVSFEDAKAAVVDHFRNSTEYLKPAHITAYVKAKSAVSEADMRGMVMTARGLGLVKGDPDHITLTQEQIDKVKAWRDKNRGYGQTALDSGPDNGPIDPGFTPRPIR